MLAIVFNVIERMIVKLLWMGNNHTKNISQALNAFLLLPLCVLTSAFALPGFE